MTLKEFTHTAIKIELPGIPDRNTISIPPKEVFRVNHIFENKEYEIPAQYLPSGPLTIVDVGANVGLFALYMKYIRKDSTIHCFEPVPQSLELLQSNLEACEGITVHPYALSNRAGTAHIYLNTGNMGENSFKKHAGHNGRTAAVLVKDAATVFSELGLTYIDVLKVDTEGCEVEILESLQSYLPYVGIVMAEYHSESDRRQMDVLLKGHTLFDANPCGPQLGLVKYINSRLV